MTDPAPSTPAEPAAIEAPSESILDALRESLLPGALAILVMVLAVYLPAMQGRFVWDDDVHVSRNLYMAEPGGFAKLWGQSAFYYPLTSTTFWLERRLWAPVDAPPEKMPTAPYHQLNIILHALNSILLWRLLRRLRIPGAWVAGAVFALHPVNVQSVAWITELKNCQSGFFFLLALHAWLNSDSGWRALWYGATIVLFACAVLSKTSTVVLPFALLAIDAWKREPLNRKSALRYAPLFVLSLVAGLLTVILHRPHVTQTTEFIDTYPERVIIAGRGVWFYLSKAFWPTNLSFVYTRWKIDAANWISYLPATGVLAMTILLFLLRKRLGIAPLIAWSYYVASLIPVMGFFKMFYTRYSYVADHWQYLGLMCAIPFTVGVVAHFFQRVGSAADTPRPPVAAIVLTSLLLGLFGSLTWRQAHVYQSPIALWQDVLKKNPASWMAHNNYGTALREIRDEDAAFREFNEAARLRPNFWEAHFNLGTVMLTKKMDEESYKEFQEVVRLNPHQDVAYYNMASYEALHGKLDDAIAHYEEGLRQRSNYFEAHKSMASVYIKLGQLDEAINHLNESLKINPNQSDALTNLGGIMLNKGRTEDAIDDFNRALLIDPDNALAHFNIASALAKIGRNAEAAMHQSEALRLDPQRFTHPGGIDRPLQ